MKENQYSNMDYWMNRVYKEGKETHSNSCVLRNVTPIMKKICETIPIGKGTKILDVGCGSGNFTYQFSLLSDNVVGIDHSEYIFKKNPHKTISIMDATAMTFADNSFDIVFCSDTLHHIPEYEKAVREMIRVSKKYVVILEANSRCPLMYAVGLLRSQERLLVKKPVTMNKIKSLMGGTHILFAKHVRSYFFPNALSRVPERVLDMFPKVKFTDNSLVPWSLIIAKKEALRSD